VSSPLDRDDIASGRLVPVVAAYSPVVDGRPIALSLRGSEVVAEGSGSVFGPDGVATSGPLKGERLEPAESITTLWFAWAAFQPDTRIARR
jgi:hypothetical protein